MFPKFASLATATQWGAGIDSMPDALPVIGTESTLDGFYLSTGFSGHGFGIGPGSGELIADIIAGDKPRVDPSPYRYERLGDGTRLRPQAGAY
jgi:glycine/D-amino acid oxidase-like deaminating enzyme